MPKKKTPQRGGSWKDTFLVALRQYKSVQAAIDTAGISRRQANRVKREDEDFRQAWEEALEANVDELEQSAFHRAVYGWDEPVYYQGTLVGHKRVYSPALTIFMLKCNRPSIYNIESSTPATDAPEERARKVNEGLRKMEAVMEEVES